MAEDDYEVGYGKPPRQHRFQPGKSGNPRGRRKGAKGLSTRIKEALAETITVVEGGKKRRITTLDALLKRSMQKALRDGDTRAIDQWLGYARQIEVTSPAPAEALNLDDQSIVQAYLDRLRESQP